jgi:tyrosyl-tRNA synthetase
MVQNLVTPDADVYKFLKYFTFLAVKEIDAIERSDAECNGRPQAQTVLAREVTRLVHGQDGLSAAERITESLFTGTIAALTETDVLQLRQDGLPATTIERKQFPETLTQMLTDAGMASSGKQVKDALGNNAVTVNNRILGLDDNGGVAACFPLAEALFGRFYLVKLGKKKYHLFELR